MKKRFLAGVALVGALALVTAGCGSSSNDAGAGGKSDKPIKVGFAQTGSESGWRSANTESMKKAFAKDKQISYPNLVDGDDESLLTKLVGITSLNSVPSTIIVDRKGGVAWRALRPVDYDTLAKALQPVVDEK